MVELQYRDATPPQILAESVTAAEAAATVEGAAAGAAAVKVAGLDKPEFVTRDTFIRQAAERCPKCATKDIFSGHISVDKGSMIQNCSCQMRNPFYLDSKSGSDWTLNPFSTGQ